ncbi:MAG TPA: AMP-binding protein [Mycobacteriales bacterium]|nr:AMP-binding protein [Mycobacteriales bacterium]
MLLSALDTDLPDAVRCGEQAASTVQIRDRAERMTRRFAGAAAIAVVAHPSLDTITAVVAGLIAGVPVIPVPPDSGPMERRHILADSGADLLLDTEWQQLNPRAHPDVPDGTALVLYTSGTTGAPKGVAISEPAIAADLDALAAAWEWTPDDVLVHGLPLFHVHGLVLGVLGPLRVGSRVVHTVRPRPERYAEAAGSLYFGVPTVWSRMCADPGSARRLAGARALVSGSAALPVPVFEQLEQLTGHRPIERYGMTETLITLSSRASGPRRPGSVGAPIDGVQARILTEDGGAAPAGEPGELQVRGPVLFSGYLGRSENGLTPDGWFRTGDVALLDAEGDFRIVGRAATDLIKSGGYRIGAGEVENALLAHPAVAEAAVVGEPHPDLGQQIVAYVVADGVDEATLIEFVATGLSVHKRPRQVYFVDGLPRNAMGKVQKSLLS